MVMHTEEVRINTKPCPFCGERDIRLRHQWFEENGIQFDSYMVRCSNFECMSLVASRENMEDAVKVWERRADDLEKGSRHDQD